MSKRTDRVFHITITAFAMVLTVLSAVTMVYQGDPQWIRSWLSQNKTVRPAPVLGNGLNPPSSLSHAVPQTVPQPVANASTSPARPVSKSTGQPKHATGNFLSSGISDVSVLPVGTDVPESELTRVKQMLEQYHIVSSVAQTLQMSNSQTVQIYLAQTNADYKNELATLGLSLSDAARLSKDTGGFTQGNVILIPLSQNKTSADLVNSLGHEITHVFLNHYVSDVPSWMNEGLAVYNGMKVQSQAENVVMYDGYVRRMAESILNATVTGKLIPLTGNEQQVLQGTQSYDLELQDWLAVSWIIENNGLNQVHTYLQLLRAGVIPKQAFEDAFGEAETSFNHRFTQFLEAGAAAQDSGLDLQFSFPTGFSGSIRVLQHGTQNWTGFQARSGVVECTLTPQGTLVGVTSMATTQDANPPDAATVYINLQSKQPFVYQGQSVEDCGFAIDYHNGLYGFINNWITLKDGTTIFSRTSDLFGVSLMSVTEHQSTNPLLSLLN